MHYHDDIIHSTTFRQISLSSVVMMVNSATEGWQNPSFRGTLTLLCEHVTTVTRAQLNKAAIMSDLLTDANDIEI